MEPERNEVESPFVSPYRDPYSVPLEKPKTDSKSWLDKKSDELRERHPVVWWTGTAMIIAVAISAWLHRDIIFWAWTVGGSVFALGLTIAYWKHMRWVVAIVFFAGTAAYTSQHQFKSVWVPVTVVVVVGFAWRWRAEDKWRAYVSAQYDLRFPELDRYHPAGDTFVGQTFVDFEQMKLVIQTSDCSYCHTRVYDLRRRDGTTWERCEDPVSRKRSLAHLEEAKTARFVPFDVEQREAELRDVNRWEPFGAMVLEPRYQLFLHHHDPSVSFPRNPVAQAIDKDHVPGTSRPLQRPTKP